MPTQFHKEKADLSLQIQVLLKESIEVQSQTTNDIVDKDSVITNRLLTFTDIQVLFLHFSSNFQGIAAAKCGTCENN